MLVHVTVAPTGMVSDFGEKALSVIDTAALAADAARVLAIPGNSDPTRTAIANRRTPSQPRPRLAVVGRRICR